MKNRSSKLINRVLIMVFTAMMISFVYVSNQNLNQKKLIKAQNEQLEFFKEDYKNLLERYRVKEDSLNKSIQSLTEKISEKPNQNADDVKKIDSLKSALIAYSPISQSRNILWVDDKPSNNLSIVDHLKGKGLNIVKVKNNDDAIQKLSSMNFELVISDMNRNNNPMDGIDLTKKARQKGFYHPVIIYSSSAAASKEKTSQAISAGAELVTSDYRELINRVNVITELNGTKIGFYYYPKDESLAKSLLAYLQKQGFSGGHQFYPKDEKFFDQVDPPKTFEIRYDGNEKVLAIQIKNYLDGWNNEINFKLLEVKSKTYGFISVFIPKQNSTTNVKMP